MKTFVKIALAHVVAAAVGIDPSRSLADSCGAIAK